MSEVDHEAARESDDPVAPCRGDARCFHCGAPTPHRFGERWVCSDCYAARASCCTEFEDDDDDDGAEA